MAKKSIVLVCAGLVALITTGFLCVPSKLVKAMRPAIPGGLSGVPVEAWSNDALAELTWKTLSDVQYKDIYVQELDAYYWKPTFGASVKALEGKDVFISGYMIPVDYDENFYVISRYPYANCFFCGGGGPESVVDLRIGDKHRVYKTDERLTFKGKLKLNADNIYEMNYILLGAGEYTP